MEKLNLNLTIDPVALLALVVAVVSLWVAWRSFKRDRADAKITVMHEAHIKNARPPYSSDITYVSITVTNVGRRPLTINHVGFKKLWSLGMDYVIGDSLRLNPKRIEEGHFASYLVERDTITKDMKYNQVAYFFAVDATGKEYRKTIAPWPLVALHRLAAWLVGPLMRRNQRRASSKKKGEEE